MRYKAWPYFEDWKEVFGKDRATGENAEDVVEAWNNIRKEEPNIPHGTQQEEDTAFSQDNGDYEPNYDQVSQSARDEQPSKQNISKKRKVKDQLDGVCELLSVMNQSTNTRLEHLATRIGYEFDMAKARQETFNQLGEIAGLSLENRFIIVELVAFKAERLDVWRGMKPEDRAQYVDHLLKTKGV